MKLVSFSPQVHPTEGLETRGTKAGDEDVTSGFRSGRWQLDM